MAILLNCLDAVDYIKVYEFKTAVNEIGTGGELTGLSTKKFGDK
jgi:hypothetical protein